MSETIATTEAPAPRRATPRVLLVIGAQPTEAMRAAIAAGQEPRRDYDALRDMLDADALHPDDARRARLDAFAHRFAAVLRGQPLPADVPSVAAPDPVDPTSSAWAPRPESP